MDGEIYRINEEVEVEEGNNKNCRGGNKNTEEGNKIEKGEG